MMSFDVRQFLHLCSINNNYSSDSNNSNGGNIKNHSNLSNNIENCFSSCSNYYSSNQSNNSKNSYHSSRSSSNFNISNRSSCCRNIFCSNTSNNIDSSRRKCDINNSFNSNSSNWNYNNVSSSNKSVGASIFYSKWPWPCKRNFFFDTYFTSTPASFLLSSFLGRFRPGSIFHFHPEVNYSFRIMKNEKSVNERSPMYTKRRNLDVQRHYCNSASANVSDFHSLLRLFFLCIDTIEILVFT